MNTHTGEIYRGQAAIDAAIGRGEPVVPVSERVARFMELGQTAEVPVLDGTVSTFNRSAKAKEKPAA